MKGIKNIQFSSNPKSLVTTGLTVLVCLLLILTISYKSNMLLSGLDINVDPIVTKEGKKYLISKKEIKHIIEAQIGFELKQANVNDLDLMALEEVITNDSRIYNAEIYLTKNHTLTLDIIQRKPLYRVNRNGKSPYYMDENGRRISVRKSLKKMRVPIVTGSVNGYKPNFMKSKTNNLKDIHNFFLAIKEDELMTPLVEQLNVDDKGEYILIPKVGNKKIILGTMDNLDEKLKNLKTYYKEVGMDDFRILDLRFKDQVVGRT